MAVLIFAIGPFLWLQHLDPVEIRKGLLLL
jgi:hypothetical protein